MKPETTRATKAIIFDFDGTIADSFGIFLESLNAALRRQQLITASQIEELRKSSSTKEIIKKLGIKTWQLPLVLVRGRREVGARMERVRIFAGMPEVLKQLAQEYSIFILSTNSKENIVTFLKREKLGDYIDGIYGSIGLMGKSKSLKKLLQQEGVQLEDCLYIGDETRDIEAARKIDMKCIAVSWGYSYPDVLAAHEPDVLVDTPQRLLAAIARQMV